MNKTGWTVLIVVIAIIIVGGIYWYSTMSPSYTAPAASATLPATTTAPSAGPTIVLGSNTQFPSYLTATNGMALYTFKSDTTGVSNCSGSCAAVWPPYIVSSAAGLSVESNIAGTIGTIMRSDGTLQVTYNGMPLYFFAQDTSTGDVTGNGQGGFSVAMATASQPAAAPNQVQVQTQVQPAPAQPAPTTPAYNY